MSRRRSTSTFLIRSIQQGSVAINGSTASGTTAITAVTLANSMILYEGYRLSYATAEDIRRTSPRLELTDTTTVTAYRQANDSATAIPAVGFTVVEFYPGILKSVQRGTIAIAAATSNTATLSQAVSTTRAMVMFLGVTSDALAAEMREHYATVTLTNGTTVTATVTTAGSSVVVGYQVVEFHASPLYG